MSFQRQADEDGPTQDPISASLGLVADSNSIRENIVDEFTCDGRSYGYYADVANDCQLFHVCYPVAYPDGQEEMLKWSFICPNQTIFDQVNFIYYKTRQLMKSGFKKPVIIIYSILPKCVLQMVNSISIAGAALHAAL